MALIRNGVKHGEYSPFVQNREVHGSFGEAGYDAGDCTFGRLILIFKDLAINKVENSNK
jgi:hypothetical protein